MFFRFVTKHACDRETDNYDLQNRASIAASCGNKTIIINFPKSTTWKDKSVFQCTVLLHVVGVHKARS